MNKILAWVTSVSSRVIARNLEREPKKIGRGKERVEVETPSLPPPPSSVIPFFCSRPKFSRRTRTETLATEANKIVIWLRTDTTCNSNLNENKGIAIKKLNFALQFQTTTTSKTEERSKQITNYKIRSRIGNSNAQFTILAFWETLLF